MLTGEANQVIEFKIGIFTHSCSRKNDLDLFKVSTCLLPGCLSSCSLAADHEFCRNEDVGAALALLRNCN